MHISHSFVISRFDTGDETSPVHLYLRSVKGDVLVNSSLWPFMVTDQTPGQEIGLQAPLSSEIIGRRIECLLDFNLEDHEALVAEGRSRYGTFGFALEKMLDLTDHFKKGVPPASPEGRFVLELRSNFTKSHDSFPHFDLRIPVNADQVRQFKELQPIKNARVRFRLVDY